MSRIILLPGVLEKRLFRLADMNREVSGVLFYRTEKIQEIYCYVIDTIFITGGGTSDHPKPERERVKVTKKFERTYPDYRTIPFHTHSKGTSRRYGNVVETSFSTSDIHNYKLHLREQPDFIGMVATPVTKLLYAPDEPRIKIYRKFDAELEDRIHDELNKITINGHNH